MLQALKSALGGIDGAQASASPVTGPLNVLKPNSGAMAGRLEDAIAAMPRLDGADCLAHSRQFSWQAPFAKGA